MNLHVAERGPGGEFMKIHVAERGPGGEFMMIHVAERACPASGGRPGVSS